MKILILEIFYEYMSMKNNSMKIKPYNIVSLILFYEKIKIIFKVRVTNWVYELMTFYNGINEQNKKSD